MGQAVDAAGVFQAAICIEAVFALRFCPTRERGAFANVFKEWHTVSAGGLDEINIEHHHLARTGRLCAGERRVQQGEVFERAARDDASLAIETEDRGRAFEGAEHEGEASIGAQMRCGFIAAAGLVEVDDGTLVEHTQGGSIAGRDIDPAILSSGSIEENMLLQKKFAMRGLDRWELLSQGIGLLSEFDSTENESASKKKERVVETRSSILRGCVSTSRSSPGSTRR